MTVLFIHLARHQGDNASQAGEGYGNLHERPLVDILNRFDEAFVHQLHANRRLEEYLPLVDRSLFGGAFPQLFSLREAAGLWFKYTRGCRDFTVRMKPNDKTIALRQRQGEGGTLQFKLWTHLPNRQELLSLFFQATLSPYPTHHPYMMSNQ